MATEFTITQICVVAKIKIIGQPTFEDIMKISMALVENGKFSRTLRLWDLQECQMNLTTGELKEIGSYNKKFEDPHSRVAIVATSDLNFGLARIHQVFRESEHTLVNVFRNEVAAMEWLLTGSVD